MHLTTFEVTLNNKAYHVSTSSNDVYILPGTERLPVAITPAWCPDCGDVVEGERLPSRHELTDQIEKLTHGSQHPGLIPPDHHVRLAELPVLKQQLAWITSRASPSR